MRTFSPKAQTAAPEVRRRTVTPALPADLLTTEGPAPQTSHRGLHQALNRSPRAAALAQLQSVLNGGQTGVLQRRSVTAPSGVEPPLMRKKRTPGEKKDPPQPGRRKRRLAAQETELAEMQRQNEQWDATHPEAEGDPYANPFSALDGLEEDTAPEETTPVEPPFDLFAELMKVKDSAPEIRKLLTGRYEDKQIGDLSRALRTGKYPIHNMQDLEKAANVKRAELEQRDSVDGGSRGPSGALNKKGGPVSGLKKGKGAGWLAGDGASWHVHYDHVKFGSDGKSRVNFTGRKRAAILKELGTKGNPKTGAHGTNYADCVAYINTYCPV